MAEPRNYRLLLPITAIFTATLLITNTVDAKIFTFLGMNLPVGIILFPLAYLVGDVLTEVYGYAETRKVIWSAFACIVLMVVSYKVACMLPPTSFMVDKEPAFDAVLGAVPRIACASIAAYLCGEFTNSYVLAKLKVRMQGKAMSVRFIASTVFGQFVDTAVFIAIAFAGVMPIAALISIFFSAWAFKVVWEIIALPITLPFVRWVKRVEGVDHYDTHTNFNPFKVAEK